MIGAGSPVGDPDCNFRPGRSNGIPPSGRGETKPPPDGKSRTRRRFQGLSGRAGPGDRRGGEPQPDDPRPRVRRPRRPVRLRQVDHPAHDRGLGGGQQRRHLPRRPPRQRCRAEGPRPRDGLPELRPLPAYDGSAQHGLRPGAAEISQGRDREAGPRGGGLLGLSDEMLDRKPKALSGGERQRVAVGRAIVRKPKAFLFDEPLSNLDAKMRVQMRTEISKLHTRLSTTMVYVTHDQAEAMTMGDRIVVMKDGRIQQVAEPLEIYHQPANAFVGGVHRQPAHELPGRDPWPGRRATSSSWERGPTRRSACASSRSTSGSSRPSWERRSSSASAPEDLEDRLFRPEAPADQVFPATVEVVEPMGAETYLYPQRRFPPLRRPGRGVRPRGGEPEDQPGGRHEEGPLLREPGPLRLPQPRRVAGRLHADRLAGAGASAPASRGAAPPSSPAGRC